MLLRVFQAGQRLQRHHRSQAPAAGEPRPAMTRWNESRSQSRPRTSSSWLWCSSCNDSWVWSSKVRNGYATHCKCGVAWPVPKPQQPGPPAKPAPQSGDSDLRLLVEEARNSGMVDFADKLAKLLPKQEEDPVANATQKATEALRTVRTLENGRRQVAEAVATLETKVVSAKERIVDLSRQIADARKIAAEATDSFHDCQDSMPVDEEDHLPTPDELGKSDVSADIKRDANEVQQQFEVAKTAWQDIAKRMPIGTFRGAPKNKFKTETGAKVVNPTSATQTSQSSQNNTADSSKEDAIPTQEQVQKIIQEAEVKAKVSSPVLSKAAPAKGRQSG